MRVTSGVPRQLHRGNAVVPLRVTDVPSDGNTLSSHATPCNVSFFFLRPSLQLTQPCVIDRGWSVFP